MKLRNLLLGLAMLAVSGLVAMSQEEKQQFKLAVQTAKTTEDMKAIVNPLLEDAIEISPDPEELGFLIERKVHSIHSPLKKLSSNSLERALDARDILDECLFQDLDIVLNSEEAKTCNPVPTMMEKCIKYTWNDASSVNTLRGLCSARNADQNSPEFKQWTAVQQSITAANTAAKKKKMSDDTQANNNTPSKLNVHFGKYALCTVVSLAAIYGIYHILSTKKKKSETKGDTLENDHKVQNQEEQDVQA